MSTTLVIASLVLLGIIMIFIEFLLTPGMGFAGIVGIASFVGACVFAFMRTGTTTGTIVTAVVVVIVVALFVWMLRSKTWKRFEQKEEIDVKTNREAEKVSEGETGTTVSRLAPIGKVEFARTTCEAKSADGLFIDPGVRVNVLSIEGNEILVRPITEENQPVNNTES